MVLMGGHMGMGKMGSLESDSTFVLGKRVLIGHMGWWSTSGIWSTYGPMGSWDLGGWGYWVWWDIGDWVWDLGWVSGRTWGPRVGVMEMVEYGDLVECLLHWWLVLGNGTYGNSWSDVVGHMGWYWGYGSDRVWDGGGLWH
ncbi:hypothetical protein G9A89_000188 [Geosiphon pyriformis]|nr:hypothetical protein G9A89_000188 [Geosiphon pyriformis]